MSKKALLLALMSSVLVVACTTTSAPDPRFTPKTDVVIPAQVVLSTQKDINLEDTKWQLVALTRSVNANQIQDGAFLNFQSVNSRLNGSTGCNRLMGGYRVQGELIKLSEIASTKIFCPRGGIIRGALLVVALNDTRAWRIEAGHLYLLDEKGEKIAVFEVH